MRLVDVAIRRRVTIAMVTLAIALFGWVSLGRLKVNLLPDLSYPTLTVRTELPGAAPLEVENLVTRPIEEAAGVIRNVRVVRSVSRAGQSDVVLEFVWGTDMDFAGIDVRERLDLLQLPDEAVRPLILRFDPSTEPVLRLALVRTIDLPGVSAGDQLRALRRYADDRLKPDLEALEGSAAVKVSGGFEDEIQVYVDQDRLSQLGLGVAQVAARLGAENVNLSGGRLEQGTQRFLVRTVNEFTSLDDMADSVIATIDNRPVYLKDVARVERGYKERAAIARLGGRECIELAIYKEGDANTVQLAESIAKTLETVRKNLPPGTELHTVYDQSRFIASAVDEVKTAALWGGLLAIIVMYLFLRDARATLVAGIVIPVTVIGIFVLMFGFDLTLNIMSLGGIALSVGMLIDNSVVILEAIARKREAGLGARAAALEGTSEVAMAVTASTLTTVAVFFPMVFVSGIAGQLFRDQALTVTFAQLLSLIVSLTLVPMLAAWRADTNGTAIERRTKPRLHTDLAQRSRTLVALVGALPAAVRRAPALRPAYRSGWAARWPAPLYQLSLVIWLPIALIELVAFLLLSVGRVVASLLGELLGLLLAPAVAATQTTYTAFEQRYPRALRAVLAHRTLVIVAALLLLAGTALLLPRLGTELIPQLSQGEFTAKLRLAPGTPLEVTDQMVRRAQLATNKLPNLERAYSMSGTGNRLDANPVDAGENTGELAIVLRKPAGELQEAAAVEALRAEFAKLPGVQYEFTRPTLFSLSTPLEVVLAGYEIEPLAATAARVRAAMESSDSFRDIRSSVEGGNPEIQIVFDQDRASQLGLTVRDVADRVVASVRGDVATRYRWRDKKIDVLVRSVDTRAASIEEIRSLVVNPGAERPVPLAAVADVQLALGPAEIRRANQERVAILSASPAGNDLGAATLVAQAILDATPLPAGVTASVAGQSEDMQQSFRAMLLALGLAAFLVYIVMAMQFESLLHPLVILFTVPMGLIGAIWALWLTGTTINAVAMIGMILLAGIVVNNAIVLVDAINQARDSGMEIIDAIVAAGAKRLRPILITSISTILGLAPMVLGLGEGAEIRRPMAITVIGGMLLATILTLFLIPVLYATLDRRARSSVALAPATESPP
ncbi:MAG TPA: efflux RND transporter permease subunit [Steroidobacteraceae bacterium]|nr:efflux RND transporter permease subunit [Steroidobacteraceae bacterium]